MCAFDPSTWEAETIRFFFNSKLAWSTVQVPGKPRLHKETLSQHPLQKKKKKERGRKRERNNYIIYKINNFKINR